METNDVAIALQELQEQREFLLANEWVQGPPSGRKVQGCLIERNCMASGRGSDFISVVSLLARAALVYTLAQMGYPVRLVPEGFYDHELMRLGNAITTVNDMDFTSPGEAIETLERAILNIKEAFGEGGS